MSYGTISPEDRSFVETWANIAEYTNVIIKLDARGDEKPEIISGDRKFTLTTEERLITQGKILEESNDPFLNGSFRPLIVPDSVTAESNPNALSDEEITQLFGASQLAFDEWLSTLDSPATLDRMLRLARASDDLTMGRFRTIEERWLDLHPKKRLTTGDSELAKFIGHDAAADADAARRGGRSTQYRS